VLVKENKHNFQIHATEALKKRGRGVLEGESAIGIHSRELAREGKHPLQNQSAATEKKRADSVSKAFVNEGSKFQVNWNKNLQVFIEFDGIPSSREPTIGKWFHSQKANLRNMVKKDEVYANNLARLIAAARKKTTPFSHIIK
jgi:hypothetical protein